MKGGESLEARRLVWTLLSSMQERWGWPQR